MLQLFAPLHPELRVLTVFFQSHLNGFRHASIVAEVKMAELLLEPVKATEVSG